MKNVKMILVGGFLGAGKTTLLGRTAKMLTDAGKRVGIITNDQADDLVDTGFLKRTGSGVREVAGGCFCCRFDDLVNAAEKLLEELKPDVLLGEPVGSCTDISATVLQPLKELYGEWFTVAPFSVLTDPVRLRQALADGNPTSFPDSVLYIFRKQLEEADTIVLNKTDLLSAEELDALKKTVTERYPGVSLLTMSALSGEGVDSWLEGMMSGHGAGHTIAEVDYDTYAEGEAVLGWLNATVNLSADEPQDWADYTQRLMQTLFETLRGETIEIAHLKVLMQSGADALVANATNLEVAPTLRGELPNRTDAAILVVNARVHTTPEALKALVEKTLAEVSGDAVEADILHIQSLSPGRPQPIHRYGHVVE